MAIPAISSLLSPISSISGISKSIGINPFGESSSNSMGVSSPAKMMQSILQSLEQMQSKTTVLSEPKAEESVGNFIQNLVEAIQSQQGSSSPNTSTSRAKPTEYQNQFDQSLQTLIDQINQRKDGSSKPIMDQLSQSADQLFTSMGIQPGNQALSQLLSNFQQSFTGSSPVGNILSIKA